MSARFIVSSAACSVTDQDGSTILHTRKGILFSAIGLASDLWITLSNQPDGLGFDELCHQAIADHPHVPKERIECDVQNVLNQLIQKELVNESNRSNRSNQAEMVGLQFPQSIVRAFIATLLAVRLFGLAALFQLFLFDLTMALGGFRLVYETVNQWPVSKSQSPNATQKLSEALNQAARYYPKTALCVQRSVALTCLLRSSGVPAETVIACRKVPFKGHAWVEVAGQVINDKPKVQGFYNSVLTRC